MQNINRTDYVSNKKNIFLVEVEEFRWRLYYDMTYINNIGKTKKGYWSDNLEEKLLSMRIIDCQLTGIEQIVKETVQNLDVFTLLSSLSKYLNRA